jgi:hypothetical protein
VDAAIQRALRHSGDVLAQREVALRDARRELDNIAGAIRAGMITPTTKTLLEDAERRVAALEEAMREAKQRPAAVTSLRSVLERYLRNLRATLKSNVDDARRMLSIVLDRTVLRRDGIHLVAELTGNLAGLLSLEDGVVARVGAGRGIWKIPTRWVPLTGTRNPGGL